MESALKARIFVGGRTGVIVLRLFPSLPTHANPDACYLLFLGAAPQAKLIKITSQLKGASTVASRLLKSTSYY
jgi:hypothetical protein